MLDSLVTRHATRVFSVARDGATGDTVLDAGIARSWNRCLDSYGLDPAQPHQPRIIEATHLREHQQRLETVLEIARNEMQSLYQQIAGSGFAILLTDHQGVILECVSDPNVIRLINRAGLGVGAVWSEEHEGTNGIGTCLAEKQPVTVHRDEHFMSRHTGLTCSATPIFDPHGQLLAVLDASSADCRDSKQSQFHTVALTTMSAKLIENCHFIQNFHQQWVLRFHTRPEFVGLLSEGMLAFDGAGKILAINQGALNQLPGTTRQGVIGRSVEEIFDVSLEALLERASRQPSTVWPLRDRRGRDFYARLRGCERPVVRQPARPRVTLDQGQDQPRHPDPMGLDGLRGSDPVMAYNVRCARRVMDREINILLSGETGTGKEAFAKAVHEASRRADKPFVAVNCASIPESLIESELFGYRHGAFTGARREGMKGKVLQSSGGTLFLDEIGDMPPQLQTRLLRVLEEREILPLGTETPIPVDLHVISATHRNLPELVEQGIFREDLYYRLNGLILTLPALRERADREGLIRQVLALESQGEPLALEDDAFTALLHYPWPGNIRQLRNVLRTAAALCEDEVIRLEDLPPEVAGASAQDLARRLRGHQGPAPLVQPVRPLERHPLVMGGGDGSALQDAEREALLRVLDQHRWNVTNTANHLGVSRNTLYRKMKKHGITPPTLA